MGNVVQFPVTTMIEKANRESARRDTERLGIPYETPHEQTLTSMELAMMNIVNILNMPHQVLNTLHAEPRWFTYDQPVTADLFFDILQSEIGRKRKELAESRAITNNIEER